MFAGGKHHGKEGDTHAAEEFCKVIRRVHQVPPEKVYIPTKVTRRTSHIYNTEKDSNHITQRYSRHKENFSKGFFTPCHQPYAPVGGDSAAHYKDLVCEELKKFGSIPPVVVTSQTENKRTHSHEEKHGVQKVNREKIQGKESAKKKTFQIQKKIENHVGFGELHNKLKESKQRVKAVRCGQGYEQFSAKMQAISKHKAKCGKDDKNTMLSLSQTETSKLRSILVRKPLMANAFLLRVSDRMKTDNERRMDERKKQYFVEELKVIYMLLCSMTNMRTKHLKSKVPLSQETLKQLKKDPFEESGNQPCTTGNLPFSNLTCVSPGRSPESRHQSSLMSGGKLKDLSTIAELNQNPSQVRRSSHLRRSSAAGSTLLKKRFLNTFAGGKNHPLLPTQPKFETWDDFLQVDPKEKEFTKCHLKGLINKFRPSIMHRRHGVVAESFQTAVKLLKSHTPLWQQPNLSDKYWKSLLHKEEGEQEGKDSKDMKVEKLMETHFGQLVELRNELYENCKSKVEKIERERLNNFRNRLKAVQVTPVSLYEEYQGKLRGAVNRKLRSLEEILENNSLAEDNTVKWLEYLKKYMSLGGCAKDPEIQELLKKISKFAGSEIWNKVGKTKEKLCLLTMSLQASEICSPPVQGAIRFVLEDIIGGSYEMFERWIHHRKLFVTGKLQPSNLSNDP
ncbi:uncharacterized protein LOC106153240 [Lingula anatina]|uniref:Uncharacterized protein LOC106153240 n=1 Tax=Lingula anatina TaxID=7574 RepID=A0A1S3H8X9_LINAN|nr:uncharacterized protein LOC106153240 [Lingula anatina]|eukprot:XP_013382545.1 uncharacterized protein LOC106153240 [Lingula anatina]